jgi:membrane protein DedA with SNARE-associated domain
MEEGLFVISVAIIVYVVGVIIAYWPAGRWAGLRRTVRRWRMGETGGCFMHSAGVVDSAGVACLAVC